MRQLQFLKYYGERGLAFGGFGERWGGGNCPMPYFLGFRPGLTGLRRCAGGGEWHDIG